MPTEPTDPWTATARVAEFNMALGRPPCNDVGFYATIQLMDSFAAAAVARVTAELAELNEDHMLMIATANESARLLEQEWQARLKAERERDELLKHARRHKIGCCKPSRARGGIPAAQETWAPLQHSALSAGPVRATKGNLMSKRICILIDLDDDLTWPEAYGVIHEFMSNNHGLPFRFEGWESADGDWFHEDGEELS